MRTSDCAHYCLNLIVLLQGLKYILCKFKQTKISGLFENCSTSMYICSSRGNSRHCMFYTFMSSARLTLKSTK